jgi:hypothetical protein
MSRLTRRLAAPLSVAALCAAFAGSAHASITVTNTTPRPTDTTRITVTSAPAGATQWTAAECNISDANPAKWGLDCNGATALNFASVSSTPTRTLSVTDVFTDVSFVPGSSPQWSSTACDSTAGGDPCAVIVSYYNASFTQLGVDVQPITFF